MTKQFGFEFWKCERGGRVDWLGIIPVVFIRYLITKTAAHNDQGNFFGDTVAVSRLSCSEGSIHLKPITFKIQHWVDTSNYHNKNNLVTKGAKRVLESKQKHM